MQFIEATQDLQFRNTVQGEGSLIRGKTYYTFGQFARETAARGLARIVHDRGREIVHFKPSHLGVDGPRKILHFFSGGLGDAVTAGIVLPVAADRHGLSLDLCCDRIKWQHVFQPMGMKGRHVPYPPDLETLSRYEAVLSDLTEFYPSGDGLRTSPVAQLIRGFHLEENVPTPGYEIPHEVRRKWELGPSGRFRIGVNFDSQGLVKSYPEHLQETLLHELHASGMEVYLLGSRNDTLGTIHHGPFRVRDLRGATTIPELAALIEQMDLILGVDSFIAHLSNLLAKRTLVLLSTTSAASFSWHRHIECKSSGLGCSPCFSLFDRCAKGYPGCRAFESGSIAPPVIARIVLERLESRVDIQARP